MSFISDIKNALSYLLRGEWREFAFRLKVYTGKIDLKNDSPNALATERTHPYSHSAGLKLEKVLNSLKIAPQDSIVDFGSGKGGALITFSKYPFAKITGVEISPKLVAIAEDNLRKLKIRNIHMAVCDATDFTNHEEYNYFYFANPFPGNILRSVIKNIESSLIKKPRKVVIIYFNPIYHDAIIDNSSFLMVKKFNHCPLGFSLYSNTK